MLNHRLHQEWRSAVSCRISFASNVERRNIFSFSQGGAFGQCVFAIVLQKLFDIYRWNGAMMLFSGIVLCIVAFGALFREVEWDEEEYDDDEGIHLKKNNFLKFIVVSLFSIKSTQRWRWRNRKWKWTSVFGNRNQWSKSGRQWNDSIYSNSKRRRTNPNSKSIEYATVQP